MYKFEDILVSSKTGNIKQEIPASNLLSKIKRNFFGKNIMATITTMVLAFVGFGTFSEVFNLKVEALPLVINATSGPNVLVGLNQTGIWSNAGTVGGEAIDLHATVTAIDSGVVVGMVSNGNDPSIQLDSGGFGYGGTSAGSVTVRWQIFEAGTENPLIGEPSWTVLDIDGAGSPNTIETITPDVEGLLSYELGDPSALVDTSVGGQLTVSGTDSDTSTPPPGPDRDSAAVTFNWAERFSWEITYTNHLNNNGRIFNHDGNGEFSFTGATQETFLPQLDLDGDDDTNGTPGSADYTGFHVNDNTAVPITDVTDTTITNVTGNLDGLVATLTNEEIGDALTINGVAGTSGTVPGTSIAFSISGGVVTLSGAATTADYVTALESIRFNTTAATTNLDDRIIEIVTSVPAGGSSLFGNLATATISFTQDTDGDLVPDAYEAVDGTNVNDPLDYEDDDGDLVPNYIENQDGTSNSDDSDFADEDTGGTPDYVEVTRYTNEGLPVTDPTTGNDGDDDRDLDGDGASDYNELQAGTNPLGGVIVTTNATTVEVGEDGTTDTVDYVLMSEPDADVTLTIAADPEKDFGRGFNTPHVLTFTPANWDTPQTVTVTNADNDEDEDGATYVGTDMTYTVVSAGDSDFDGNAPLDTPVTVTNDDNAGVSVNNSAGITVIEDGANGSFDVVLESEPTENVTINVTSSDTGAATVSVSSLTFTAADWDTPQSVTISPVTDDDVVDETVTITFSIDDANSDDVYDSLADVTRSVGVTDSDSARFTVSPTSGSVDINEGQTLADTFSVVLDQQPQSDVVIDVTSPDASALVVDTTSVTFTAVNWNTPQDVSVSAPEDPDFDSEADLLLNFTVNDGSSDNDFDLLSDQVREVDVIDNEVAGFTVTPSSDDLLINEGSTEDDYYSVVLDAQPIDNVVIDVTSSDISGVTTSPTSLTFTNSNWDIPQTVDVVAPEDDDLVNELNLLLTFSVNDGASDDNFDALADQTRGVDVTDNDTATIVVSPTGITVNENAGADIFTVVLGAEPQSPVVIDLASSDIGEGTVSPTILAFTPSNWNTPQSVIVEGVNDDIDRDDTVDITVTVNDSSSDNDFDGLNDTVAVTLTDDDVAGITVTPTTVNSDEGDDEDVDVVLDSEPESDVVLYISSSDSGAVSVSDTTLTFTPSNWNTPQTITLTSEQDDDVVDETVSITITVDDASSDDTYDALADETVTNNVSDDDSADIVVSPTGITVNENAGTDDFTVVLSQQPQSDVVIDLTSGDTDEATVTPATLTFSPSNWDQPQTVSITGIPDVNISDDEVGITVTVNDGGSDDDWDGVSDTVAVTLTDDDVDTDGDLVTDEQEAIENTDENDPTSYQDSDGDLVPDYVETELQELEGGSDTNPNDENDFADDDNGTTPNYVEETLFPNVGLNATDPGVIGDDQQDSDGDLVPDYSELMDESEPEDHTNYTDDDGDLVPNFVEDGDSTSNSDSLDYNDDDGDLVPNYVENILEPNNGLTGTNENDPTDFNDTDGDLVPDYVEATRQENAGGSSTDENDASDVVDTDGGGLPDYTEETYLPNISITASTTSDPADDIVDNDGDGVPTLNELTESPDSNPADITSYNDDDGDGHPNHVENLDGSDPTDPNSLPLDTDEDGVPDIVETIIGTDPLNNLDTPADTDSDDNPDYIEVVSGSDPNDDNSIPDDTDGDLVPDSVELVQNTDQNNNREFGDIDGDLVPGYVESVEGTNSNDNTDYADDDGTGTPNYVEVLLFPAYGAPATDPGDGSDDDIDTDNGQKSDYQELLDGSDIFDITDDTDADVDNVPDTVEQGASNNGDGNGDGIPDYVQSDVTSNINPVTGVYTTLAIEGDECNDITNFELVTEASLSTQDEDSIFEIGLHDFTVDCGSVGATAEVVVYWDQVYDSAAWTYKKFNPNTNEYSDISDQVIHSNETVGTNEVTVTRYSVVDGGPLDTDGAADGSIADPAGPTTTDPSLTLLRTGGENASKVIQMVLFSTLGIAFVGWYLLAKMNRNRVYTR